jgi:hypothetical protein
MSKGLSDFGQLTACVFEARHGRIPEHHNFGVSLATLFQKPGD